MGHLKTTSAVLVGSHTVKNKALGFDMHIYCSTISSEELRPSTDGSAVCTRLSCRQPACLQPKAAAARDRQTDGRIVVSLNALLLRRNNKRKRQKTSEVALKAPVSALTQWTRTERQTKSCSQ